MKYIPILKDAKAVTMLEVLISVGIFTLVSASVLLVFDRSLVVYRSVTNKNNAAQEAQTVMEWLGRDISSAYSIAAAGPDSITLVNPQQHSIRYSWDPATNTLQRQDNAGPSNLLAEHISQFSLKYYNIANAPIADPANNILSLKTIEMDTAVSNNNQEFRFNTVARFKYNPRSPWAKAYGGTKSDTVASLQQINNGYILGGSTHSFGAGIADFIAIKTDVSGAFQWAKTYGGASSDYLCSWQQTRDGGYISGGYTDSGADGTDAFLIKTDASGTLQWARTYGGTNSDVLRSLQQTSDGGYIVGGYTTSFGASAYLLIKTDATGAIQWARTYGGTRADDLRSLQQTSDGGYILGGNTQSFAAGATDFLVIKTDATGAIQWARTYGGTNFEMLWSLQQTSDGGYIVGGDTRSFGAVNFLVIKTDASGAIQWARTYGGTNYDMLFSLKQTGDGYILGGNTGSFGVGGDVLLIKTDASGALQWAKAYGGANYESIFPLQQISDGYILGVNTGSFGEGLGDMLLIKTDASGNVGCCGIVQDIPLASITTKSHGTDFTLITKSHGTDFTVTTKSHGTDFTLTTKSHGTDFTVTTKSHGTDFTVITTPISPTP